MKVFKAKLRRVGGSLAVLVPKEIVRSAGASEGQTIALGLLEGRVATREELEAIAGSFPGLGPFRRDRRDRF